MGVLIVGIVFILIAVFGYNLTQTTGDQYLNAIVNRYLAAAPWVVVGIAFVVFILPVIFPSTEGFFTMTPFN